jgi:transcriptional regulator with XRE-family HTH domain
VTFYPRKGHDPQQGLGAAIRLIRKRQHMTQDALGRSAKIHPTWISSIENGKVNPTWGNVRRIAYALGVTVPCLARLAEREQTGKGSRNVHGVTEDDERQLWDEFNALLAETVPNGASGPRAERAIMRALMVHDSEIAELHNTVTRVSRTGGQGYLAGRLEEDNSVSRARRRLYGKWA